MIRNGRRRTGAYNAENNFHPRVLAAVGRERAFLSFRILRKDPLRFFAIWDFFFFRYRIIEFVTVSARNITIFVVRGGTLRKLQTGEF